MDKLTMAHDYAMKHLENSKGNITMASLTAFAWQYADAMQAEADKRKSKPELPSLQQTFINGVEQPRYAPPCEEWQPDWSQAPDYARAWQMCSTGDNARWLLDERQEYACVESPSFGYQGNWQDSLRKRPQ